jgi:ABC-2 type transport system permease protein
MYWIGLKTIVLRECRVIARYWGFTLAPPVITTILYFTLFGEIFGQRIGSIDRIDYARFLAPGLTVLWVIPYSFSHTATGLVGARFFKFIEELLVSPLPGWLIMSGYVLGGMARGFLVGMAVALTTQFFTHLSIHSIAVSIAALFLAAAVSSLGGFIAATFARSFEHVITIQILILTPLTYLGGVFTSVSMLPDWARDLSLANPMFYLVNLFRYGILGVSDVPAGTAFLVISCVGAALFLVAAKLSARGTGFRE